MLLLVFKKLFESLCGSCNHKNCCTDSAVPLVFENDLKKILSKNPDHTKNLKIKNVNGIQVNTIKKKENSTECVFWDGQTGKCQIYDVRPIDCKLYPFDIMKIDNIYHWIVYSCNKESDWKWSEDHLQSLENDESFKDLLKNLDVFSDHTDMILPDESEKTPYAVLRKVNLKKSHM